MWNYIPCFSTAASPAILHHTVWRTWLFIAYSDENDYTKNSHYLTYTSPFIRLGECTSWILEWKTGPWKMTFNFHCKSNKWADGSLEMHEMTKRGGGVQRQQILRCRCEFVACTNGSTVLAWPMRVASWSSPCHAVFWSADLGVWSVRLSRSSQTRDPRHAHVHVDVVQLPVDLLVTSPRNSDATPVTSCTGLTHFFSWFLALPSCPSFLKHWFLLAGKL